MFEKAVDDKAIMETDGALRPKFDNNGLISAIVQNAEDGTVLMIAHMNAEALSLTLETGLAHFWSRTRSTLWKKGESSGNMLKVERMAVDCDQDALLLSVSGPGAHAACHTGVKSCFFREVTMKNGRPMAQNTSKHS